MAFSPFARAGAIRSPALLALLLCLGGGAQAADGHSFEVSLTGAVGVPTGYVQVRENALQGTHLRLHQDLGIDTVETLTLAGAYHFTPNDALHLSFDTLFLYGSTRLGQDVLFNGARLQGGTTIESRPDFYRLTGLYERRLFDLPNGGHIGGEIGFTYVLLEYKLNATLSPLSVGHETKEDFLTQELPVPMLGFTIEEPLTKRLSFVGSALGGYLPKVDSLRTEGGTVYLTQSHADVAARLRYHLTRGLDLEAGYGFHYFVQRETSREDGNFFELQNHDLTLGLSYRF